MLIRFVVENFMSFRDEVQFVLFAGKKSSSHSKHVIRGGKRNDIPILKTNVIYGANSSGKSNLIKAINFGRNLVVRGFPIETRIPIKQFKLEQKYLVASSKFEFELNIKGINYAYGFILNPMQILEEWLYEINRDSERMIFTRKIDSSGENAFIWRKFILSSEEKKFLHFTAKGTPKNRLFIRETRERNLKFVNHFNQLYDWFDNNLNVIYPKSKYKGLAFKLGTESQMQNAFSFFFKYLKTGVDKFVLKQIDIEKEVIGVPVQIRNDIISKLKDKKQKALLTSDDGVYHYILELDKNNVPKASKLMSVHIIANKEVLFDLSEESDGTRRLMDLVPALIELINNPSVFIIDEIDRSIHPHLTHALLKIFHEKAKEINSQLIFTTHESNLLDLKILRKDEITFIEKDKNSASKIYSLAEFKPRTDKSIRKDYLLGRYGAIPFLSNTTDLNW